jgi:hypothetical protein
LAALLLQSDVKLELEQKSVLAATDCMQCHEQAWEQPVLNQRLPHGDTQTLAALLLQSDAELELEQKLVLAVTDWIQCHEQAWK